MATLIQFAKVQNIFYTIGAVLQSIPAISTNDPLATIIPLAYVIIVGIIKEGLTDYKRYKSDKKVNTTLVNVVTSLKGETQLRKTESLRVGDIVELSEGENIPADLLLLTTKGTRGEAFIKTAQLDGETNLKPKLPIKELNESMFTDSAKSISVDCHEPLADLYAFSARVKHGDQFIEADMKQFLHRGATLSNSDKVRGIVVHTASDCKLIMNQGKYRFKQSKLYKGINYLMIFNIVLILSFAALFATMYSGFAQQWQRAEYLFYVAEGEKDETQMQAVNVFFSCYLLLNQFVPLELLIILEMVQIFVVVFIEKDTEMMHAFKTNSGAISQSEYEIKTCQV